MIYSEHNPKLTVITPFVNEGMDVVYTTQSILNELRTVRKTWGCTVELALINNWCTEAANQHMKVAPCGRKMTRADVNEFLYHKADKWGEKMLAYSKIHPEIKFFIIIWISIKISRNSSNADHLCFHSTNFSS